MQKMKAIDFNYFIELRDNTNLKSGKLFLLYDDRDITKKKTLCKVNIDSMSGLEVFFYVRGNPQENTKILLYNKEYYAIKNVNWDEKKEKEIYFYFDLEDYLFRVKKVNYQLFRVDKHRRYASRQKNFEKEIYIEEKGFFYKEFPEYLNFNFVPSMVFYQETKIYGLKVQVFNNNFMETSIFEQFIRGFKEVVRFDRNILNEILENDDINQIQLNAEKLHLHLWSKPVNVMSVDYVSLGKTYPKRIFFQYKNREGIEMLLKILDYENEGKNEFNNR